MIVVVSNLINTTLYYLLYEILAGLILHSKILKN